MGGIEMDNEVKVNTKYSEKALLKVCYAIAVVIIAVIAVISYCLNRVLNSIT